MKSLLFILILIFGTAALGQSAKKLNKQLQDSLLVEEQKQDSVYHIFVQKRRILEEHRKKLEGLKMDFYSESLELIGNVDVISHYLGTLKELGVNTKDVISKDFESVDSFPDYMAFLKPCKDALRRFVLFEFASGDVRISNDYKTEEKNQLLADLIRKYREFEKRNVEKFRELELFTERLVKLEPRMDSLLGVYKSWNKELQEKKKLLSKKYHEARENYRLKGPKGFSAAYRKHFEDVHPLPGVEQPLRSDLDYEPLLVVDMGPGDIIYSKVDEPARYPDGMPAMIAYERKNLVYPLSAKKNGIRDKIFVHFVVSETGEISDVIAKSRIEGCPECVEEAVRFIESMPRWLPADKDGYYVKSYKDEVVWFMP